MKAIFGRLFTLKQELCYKLHVRLSFTQFAIELRRSLVTAQQKYSEKVENTPNIIFYVQTESILLMERGKFLSCYRLVE